MGRGRVEGTKERERVGCESCGEKCEWGEGVG